MFVLHTSSFLERTEGASLVGYRGVPHPRMGMMHVGLGPLPRPRPQHPGPPSMEQREQLGAKNTMASCALTSSALKSPRDLLTRGSSTPSDTPARAHHRIRDEWGIKRAMNSSRRKEFDNRASNRRQRGQEETLVARWHCLDACYRWSFPVRYPSHSGASIAGNDPKVKASELLPHLWAASEP